MCAKNQRTQKNGFKKMSGHNVPKTHKIAKTQERLALRGNKNYRKIENGNDVPKHKEHRKTVKKAVTCAQKSKTQKNPKNTDVIGAQKI